jgi:basic membrane protein A and related proteins
MRKLLRWVAVLAIVAVVAAACAEDEPTADGTTTPAATDTSTETETTEPTEPPAEAVSACMVSDTGGIDDQSFNQTAYAGLTRAESEIGAEIAFLESQANEDFAPNIDTFVGQGCDIIVTVGFLLGDATLAAAQANPEQLFAIVDFDFFDFDAGEDITLDNTQELTFATDQAAFLAGYVAAHTTESGLIGTYGGINIPTVTIFMNGVLAGIRAYNQDNGTDVQLLGWDGTDGTFTGDFENQDLGRQITEDLIAEGADIVLPVAGPAGRGTIAAAEDAGGVRVIWVDVDGCVSIPESCDLFLTTIEKKMDNAVFASIEAVANDTFEGGLYVGTLENDGVGIPDDSIPSDIADRIEELRAGISDGSVSVNPADYA